MHNLCFCLALLVSVSFLLSGSRAQYNSYGIPLQQSRETINTVVRQSNPGLYNPSYMGGANQGLSRGGYSNPLYSNPLYLGGSNQGLSRGGLSNPLYMNGGNSGLPIGGLSNPLYMSGANQGLSNYGLSNSGYGRRSVRSPLGELPR